MGLLDSKVALVTGGGRGIGRGIVEAYVREGATVVVAEIDPVYAEDVRRWIEASGAPHHVALCDVRDEAQVDSLAAAVAQRFGRLDVLVNNVGASSVVRPFAQTTPADWERVYADNLRHVLLVTHRAIPLLRKAIAGGSIISITSIEAHRGAPWHAVYAACKHAVVGFTRTIACELGNEGIRANTIAPETTVTERIAMDDWIPEKYRDQLPLWIPLGRFGTPADVAGCAVFLASALSAWMTGSTINLDGGVLAQAGWFRTPQDDWTNVPAILERGDQMNPSVAGRAPRKP